MNKKGFTLVELLVVIAIIGILATVVFINLSSATGSANDARNKIGFAQILTVAQLKNSANGSYTGLCSDSEIEKILDQAVSGGSYVSADDSIDATGGSSPTSSGVGCNDSANSFVAWVALQGTGSASFWCVDKNGSGRYDYSSSTASADGTSGSSDNNKLGSGSCSGSISSTEASSSIFNDTDYSKVN